LYTGLHEQSDEVLNVIVCDNPVEGLVVLQTRPVSFLLLAQVEGYEILQGAGVTMGACGIGKDSGSRH